MPQSTTSTTRRIQIIAAITGGAVGVLTLILVLFFFELSISLVTAAITGFGTALVVSWRDSPSHGIEAAAYITSVIFVVAAVVAWVKLSPGSGDGPLPTGHAVATAVLLFGGGFIAITGRIVRAWG